MKYVDVGACKTYAGAGGPNAPAVYVVDLPYHPFDLASIAQGRTANLVRVPIRDWNASLTPWPAPALRSEEDDFAGEASVTFEELVTGAIPAIERAEGLSPSRRGICGYSLAGLFALYAFARGFSSAQDGAQPVRPSHPTDSCPLAYPFQACACLSGSVWYEGWINYLRTLEFDASGRYAFLSVGSREKNAGIPLLRTVKKNMQASAQILQQHGCEVDYVVGPGNHFEHTQERFDAGISALDAFLSGT